MKQQKNKTEETEDEFKEDDESYLCHKHKLFQPCKLCQELKENTALRL